MTIELLNALIAQANIARDVAMAFCAVGIAMLIVLQGLRLVVAVGDYRLRRQVLRRGRVSRLSVIDPASIADPMHRYLYDNKGSQTNHHM